MTAWGKRTLSMLLWTWGGTVYFLLEVAYKTLTGRPEAISWTMLVLAVILTIPVERCGAEMPWESPLWLQALCCAALVTAAEFLAGLILNVWMGLGVWDYSDLPGNVLGQICPMFTVIWWVLCLVFIPVFDWICYAVEGGDKPHYCLRCGRGADKGHQQPH